jgi:hypothetical protein
LQFENVKNEPKFFDNSQFFYKMWLSDPWDSISNPNFFPEMLDLDSNPDPSVDNEYGSATLQSMQCNHDTNDTAHKTKTIKITKVRRVLE